MAATGIEVREGEERRGRKCGPAEMMVNIWGEGEDGVEGGGG